MLIKTHQKAYSVELEDGSRWLIWPPDKSGTLHWSTSTELNVLEIDDSLSMQALVDQDGRRVRVISADADWISACARIPVRPSGGWSEGAVATENRTA